jgi:hypothetical protein
MLPPSSQFKPGQVDGLTHVVRFQRVDGNSIADYQEST